MRPEPPRLARWTIRVAVPPRCSEQALGDLAEDWHRRADHGLRARAWYWREALGVIAGYRLRRGRRSSRTRALAATVDDARQAWRRLRRDPLFSLGAAAILAAGVGAGTALFGVVQPTLLEPLPYRDADRLVRVYESQPEAGFLQQGAAPGNFLDWRRRSATLEGITAFYASEANLTSADGVESLLVGQVTHDFFRVLGVEPLLGRGFTASEGVDAGMDNAGRFRGDDPVVVIDEGLWRSRLGGDPDAVGATIRINDQAVRVVGVVPGWVDLPDREVRAWVPKDLEATYRRQGRPTSRNARFLGAVARLAPEVPRQRAAEELETMAARLARDHPQDNAGWTAELVPLAETLLGDARAPLLSLTAAAALLLVAVCANLAGLILARGTHRSREFAVRRALGADRARIARQLLIESLSLGLVGGLAGALLAPALLRIGLPLLPSELPRAVDASLRPSTLAVGLLLGTLAAGAFGLLPAWRFSRPGASLRGDARGTDDATRARAGRKLVVVEIALAVTLLAGAGLLVRSYERLLDVDPGFDPDGVLTARVNLEAETSASAAARVAFFEALLDRLRSLPGVRAAGGATYLPMSRVGPDFDRPYWRQGEPPPGGDAPQGSIRIVTPGYLETLGIRMSDGRAFTASDRFDFGGPDPASASERVAIVNRALAEASWPTRSAVGETLVMDYPGDTYEYRIVGVVENVRSHALGAPPRPEIFLPYFQIPYPGLTVALRSDASPDGLGPALVRTVAEINPRQPVDRVLPLERLVGATVQRERYVLALLVAFAVAATVLAAVGVYSLVALEVGRRMPEMGVRLALGARPRDLRRIVLVGAARMAGGGAAVGLLLFALGSGLLRGLLYRTEPGDPMALAMTTALVLVVTLGAALPAALRAGRLDPVETIRAE